MDRTKFTKQAEQTVTPKLKKTRDRYIDETGESDFRFPPWKIVINQLEDGAIRSLQLFVASQNIWVESGEPLTN